MNDEDVSSSEISEESIKALLRNFQNGKAGSGDVCPMSEKAIAYALQEIEPEENRKIREHLQEIALEPVDGAGVQVVGHAGLG